MEGEVKETRKSYTNPRKDNKRTFLFFIFICLIQNNSFFSLNVHFLDLSDLLNKLAYLIFRNILYMSDKNRNEL